MLNRDGMRGLAVGLLLGSLAGFFAAHALQSGAPTTTIAAPINPPPATPPTPHLDIQAHLFAAEQAVQKDPKNLAAWIQLGNGYFDSHKPQQAVEAYAKALLLDPDNADVLTDQGVMYRELKAYDKAIANWERAQKLDPRHLQSLYNLGIVYAYDLQQPAKARTAWSKVVELAPGSPNAMEAQRQLSQLGSN